jgi:hypothetical protein
MFEGDNNVASRVRPTSHLLSYKMDSLNVSGHSLFWAKHLDPMAYKHGHKDHCQGNFEGHMLKAAS